MSTYSKIIAGCMSWGAWGRQFSTQEMITQIKTTLESGITTFDHADIYGAGHCETLFGEFLTELTRHSSVSREQLIITSKAGIKTNPQHYDFSPQYLLNSVDASLKRLNTDYLDMFLLHRPDYLFNAE